jgi:hypothetical protein
MDIDNIKNIVKDYKNLIKLSIWAAHKWAIKFNFSDYFIDETFISLYAKDNHILVYLEKEDKSSVIKLLIPFKALKDPDFWLDNIYKVSTSFDIEKKKEIQKNHKNEKLKKENHLSDLNSKIEN